MQSPPTDKALNLIDFVMKLQTLFAVNDSVIESIGRRARELGIVTENKTYRQWLKDLAIRMDSACPICKLPKHLGQCGDPSGYLKDGDSNGSQ